MVSNKIKSSSRLDKDSIPTLTHALERDVDLLLVEEFKCDSEFALWMLRLLGWKGNSVYFSRVLHSKRRTLNRREIDIFVEVLDRDGKKEAILLIENKIGEKEQPDQGISYKDEKLFLTSQDSASYVFTMLVCPEHYVSAWQRFAKAFDGVLTYENLEAYLRKRAAAFKGELSLRLAHKADLISQAITKERRGYEAIPIRRIGTFNEQYIALLKDLAPSIYPGKGLSKLGGKPSDSVSMIFDCGRSFSDFPKQIIPTRFAHELGRGKETRANYVNVQFRGFCGGYQKLGAVDQKQIQDAGISVHKKVDKRSGKDVLSFRKATPAVDNQIKFSASFEKIRSGILSVAELKRWCESNQPLLLRIASLSSST